MKWIVSFVVFIVCFSGCNSQDSLKRPPPSLDTLQPKLLIIRGTEQTSLFDINRNPNYTLLMSDKIFFSGLKPLHQKDHKDVGKNSREKDGALKESATDSEKPQAAEDFFLMEVFTSCLINSHKSTTAKQLTDYQTAFYIVDLLPPETLLQAKETSPPTCSFLFIIRDRNKNEYLYTLSSLSVISVEKNARLKLINDQNETAAGQIINASNMNAFDLILYQGSRFKKIKFLCEGLEKDINFEMESSLTVVAPFKFLQSLKQENLPSGKRKCRILTYGEEGFVNAISAAFNMDYDTLKTIEAVQEPLSLEEKKPKLFISYKGSQVSLFEVNKTPDFVLNMSDTIRFSGLEIFTKNPSQDKRHLERQITETTKQDRIVVKLTRTLPEAAIYRDAIIKNSSPKTTDNSDKEAPMKGSPPPMEIFINCLMAGRKYPLSIQLSGYKKDFPVVALLPPDILLKSNKKSPPPSCSFLFIIRDSEQNEFLYTLYSLPILSIQKNAGLTLMHNDREVTAGHFVDRNNFDLILRQGNTSETIEFLCEGPEQSIRIQMESEQSVIPPFKLLQSLKQDMLPLEKRKCRILTYDKKGVANAISVSLDIDFESLRKNKTPTLWMPQAGSLQMKIIHKPDKSLFRKDPRKQKGQGVHKPIHTFSVFTIPELFDQLPSDLTEEQYQLYSIKVNTECRSRLFVLEAGQFAPDIASGRPDSSEKQTEDVARTYELPLVDSFSIMSVTPREAFQIFFTQRLKTILINTTPKALNPNGKRKLKYARGQAIKDHQVQLICSYDFYIQNPKVKPVLIDSIKHREIYWNPGSYGLSWSNTNADKGYPLSLEQAREDQSIQMVPLFLKLKETHPSFVPEDFILPDEMIFFCGGIRPEDDIPISSAIYEKTFPLYEVPLYLPLSSFAKEKDFEEFLSRNKMAKCRLILQREGIVQYFSGDLKFVHIDYSFFGKLNVLSDEDTYWNFDTLSEVLYWL